MLIDSHLHLADPALLPHADEIITNLTAQRWTHFITNGTRESDWPDVTILSERHPQHVIPSYGLHPWFVKDRSENWLQTFKNLIRNNPKACVGECGLDRWIENHDIAEQIDCLAPQVALAAELNRPLTLHCLQAWGPLLDFLKTTALPKRGFLVHAFNGSYETANLLLDLGAYFSYSTYFLHPRKSKLRELYARLPLNRLLLETDAPSMAPPDEHRHQNLKDLKLNHPANLIAALDSLIRIRSEPADIIREQIIANTKNLFLEY